MFRKAETLNERLLTRLRDAASHLSRNEDRAVIGALAGMEADIESMRTLMVLVRDHFQTENSKEEYMTAEKKTNQVQELRRSAESWTPKSPVEVVLDQIAKQEKKVAELQRDLDAEKSRSTNCSRPRRSWKPHSSLFTGVTLAAAPFL